MSRLEAGWLGTVSVILAMACATLFAGTADWQLVEELRIGSPEGEGPDVFASIVALEVDAYGRIYVLDRQAQEIRVFAVDGRHVRTIGRKGSGPGEFKDAIALAWGAPDRLWVIDPANGRYSVFDTTGTFVTSHRRPFGGYALPWPGGFDREGRLYDYTGFGGQSLLVRLDAEMQPADSFVLPRYTTESFQLTREGGRIVARVPFAPLLIWRFDPRGYVWFGVNEKYRIYQRRLEGDTVRVIERRSKPIRVSRAEKAAAVANLKWFTAQGGKIDASRIRDRKPVFERFLISDAGELWVWPVLAAEQVGKFFDVFDAQGRFVAHARSKRWIAAFPPPLVRRGSLYAVTTDELDVQYVVRARVVRR